MGITMPAPVKPSPESLVAQYQVWQLLPSNAGTDELRAGLAAHDPDWLSEQEDPAQYVTSWTYDGYVTDDDLEEDRPLDQREDADFSSRRLAQYEASWPGCISTGRFLGKMRYVDTLTWKREHQDELPEVATGKIKGVKRKANVVKAPTPRKRVKKAKAAKATTSDVPDELEEEEDLEGSYDDIYKV